jgi:hypothetical protein
MNFIRSLAIAAILLIGVASPGFSHVNVFVGIPLPVPVVPVGPPVEVYSPGPFFYGGFWWWNDGGYWHRSYYEHGPWGHPYRGRVPYDVRRHHEHWGEHGRHGYEGHHGRD